MQPSRLLRNQHRPTMVMMIRKPRHVNLMLRNQVRPAEVAAQVVGGHGVAESEGGGGALLAEDDHVGEVGVGFGRGFFAEDAARWEDGADGADGETGGVDVEVAGVVL